MGRSVCAKNASNPAQSRFSPDSPSGVFKTRFFGHSPWQVKSRLHSRHARGSAADLACPQARQVDQPHVA
jgi:hypothetical protein